MKTNNIKVINGFTFHRVDHKLRAGIRWELRLKSKGKGYAKSIPFQNLKECREWAKNSERDIEWLSRS